MYVCSICVYVCSKSTLIHMSVKYMGGDMYMLYLLLNKIFWVGFNCGAVLFDLFLLFLLLFLAFFVLLYVCMCVCMYVCIYIYIYIYTYIYDNTNILLYIFGIYDKNEHCMTEKYAYACMCVRIYIQTYIYIHTCTHTTHSCAKRFLFFSWYFRARIYFPRIFFTGKKKENAWHMCVSHKHTPHYVCLCIHTYSSRPNVRQIPSSYIHTPHWPPVHPSPRFLCIYRNIQTYIDVNMYE
jgi:hypothetical protein